MSEFLLIHYKPGHADKLQYWALGGDQHPSITLGHGDLNELKAVTRGKKVSVLIDAHYTTLESVNVPSKNRNRQIQAVPFAMEDYLAEDIEDTHFALGKGNDEHNVPVIAIKRDLLEQTLAFFQQVQIQPQVITADSVAIPGSEKQWGILLDEDSALIKTGAAKAHCCDRENLPIILQALLTQYETAPENIHFYHKADDYAAESMLKNIDVSLEHKTYQNHGLEIFVQHMDEINNLNLLQGEFTPKKESGLAWLNPWKSVAAVAGIWIILYLTHASILSKQLESKNLQLTKDIQREFKRAMPDARKMHSMKSRVERRLKELKGSRASGNDSGFLQILSKASASLANNDKLNIKAAVYKSNFIDIDLSAKSLQDIEKVKNELSEISGINAVLSTTIEKDKVKGRLRLEAKG